MASTADGPSASGEKSLISLNLNQVWKSLRSYLPSPDSSFLAKLSNLHRTRSSPVRRRYGYRKSGLPLPLHSSATRSNLIADEPSRAFVILEDIIEDTLCKMHKIQKSLLFWQSRADGTDARKIYFMIFERGPKAFLDSSWEMLSRVINDGSPLQNLSRAASDTMSCNIAALTSIKNCLSSFLAEVYLEVGKHGKLLAEDADKSLPLLLMTIDNLFTKLEASIAHPREIYKCDNILSASGNDSCALIFQKLPKIDPEKSQWAATEIEDATNMIYQNLERLDSYLSFILSSCQKPKRLTLYWVRYTCGAVGLSLCSIWLLRHSSLMGSPDIDNWIREAKESAAVFVKEHVEQPLISIRDELFETFRRRHKGVMEVEEVKLTADSLHRMLLAFCEQTKGQKLPADIPDQEMLEIVMGRYEKEVMHPLQNLLSGELARAMLIQIQKLKLDLETAMLELDQILKANEINFAILAALPAFFLSLLMLFLARAWLLQDKSAEGKGKIARKQRRLLLIEVEKKLVLYQISVDQGMSDDAQCLYGMVLYSLDRLYKAVEKHAKDTGEWFSLRQDIVDLAKPDWGITYKLAVTSRMGRMYDCLLPPSSKR